jgi:hypoxanthine phosphoribosyltransferase
MTMPDEHYVTWGEFHAGVEALAMAIDGSATDVIVGVARGGLPGAVALSHRLNAALEVIRADYYEGKEQQEELHVGEVELGEYSNVLIFDDIVDTGRTMTAVRDEVVTSVAGIVETAALHVKPDREITPDYWLEETDEWVVYPWEDMYE